MAKLIDIISPIYQDLLAKCERRKIAINLDIQNLTVRIPEPENVEDFYSKEIRRALKRCEEGDKITLAQSFSDEGMRLSVRCSAKEPLDAETVQKLRDSGLEVRSRFGYDTIITLLLAQS